MSALSASQLASKLASEIVNMVRKQHQEQDAPEMWDEEAQGANRVQYELEFVLDLYYILQPKSHEEQTDERRPFWGCSNVVEFQYMLQTRLSLGKLQMIHDTVAQGGLEKHQNLQLNRDVDGIKLLLGVDLLSRVEKEEKEESSWETEPLPQPVVLVPRMYLIWFGVMDGNFHAFITAIGVSEQEARERMLLEWEEKKTSDLAFPETFYVEDWWNGKEKPVFQYTLAESSEPVTTTDFVDVIRDGKIHEFSSSMVCAGLDG
jgi:hypothetical protein